MPHLSCILHAFFAVVSNISDLSIIIKTLYYFHYKHTLTPKLEQSPQTTVESSSAKQAIFGYMPK